MTVAKLGASRGWAKPSNSRKDHYFVDSMALCRKWSFFGAVDDVEAATPSEDDCAACRRAYDAQAKAARITEAERLAGKEGSR